MIVFFGCTVTGNQEAILNAPNGYANYAPTVYPDRVMLSVPGDPATTRAVSWRTTGSDTISVAEVAVVDASPKFADGVRTVSGTFSFWENGNDSAMGHKVILENLQPGTQYAYRVGDGENWSEWFQFRTSSDKAGSFSFLYFGDVQNDIRSLCSRTLRQAYSHFPDAAFMLFAGDLVSRSQEEYWREFFYAGGWIFGMMPSLATPGNHEYDKPENQPRTFSKHWNQIYTFPSNSPAEKYQNRAYYLDYQGARFVSFDSPALGEYPGDSALLIGWLEKTLAENPHRWTIVFTHFPVYSCSQGRNNERYRDAVQPLLEKYGVDLVLTGHDHTYCRGFNPENIKVKGKNMPLYVVSVAGPKMYGLNTSFWSDRVGSMTQLYQHISIDQNELEFQSFMVSGELYDHFVIRKDKNGVNTFTEGAEVGKIAQRTEIPANALKKYTDEDIRRYRQKFQVQ
jgi:3',5'-cyclic AMP phosphodiesterase CpdA